jgi:hypothetical protein
MDRSTPEGHLLGIERLFEVLGEVDASGQGSKDSKMHLIMFCVKRVGAHTGQSCGILIAASSDRVTRIALGAIYCGSRVVGRQ